MEKSANQTLRQKAEGLLKNSQQQKNQQVSEADTLKLIQELQVHQIELELQNEELMRAKELAEIASEKYTELYDFAPTGYFTLSKNAEIIELNLNGAKILGKERSLLQNSHFCLFVSSETKPIFNLFLEKAFKTNRVESCEVTLINNETRLYVYLTGIVKENEKHCFTTAVDISRLKQMEKELREAKDHAENSDRLKTAFLQNMSHEIRTPMNAIKGFSELLVKNHNDKLKLERFTKIIDQRCDDLLEIINDILDIAKIESGQLPVYMEECNLPVLFEELTSQFIDYQQRTGKQHIQFQMQACCDPSSAIINTDKGKLKQIFINLITNAFKFTDKGTIEGGCKFNNNSLTFFVSDTGIGIPPDKQNIIFERFAQLKQDTTMIFSGTGLGLTITKGLIHLLGGEIFLESEPGKGSTFSFTLPYKIIPSTPKVPLIIEDPEINHLIDKTILIVEDDDYNAEYIKEIFIDTRLNILTAKNGNEAIKIALSQSPDIVLMDIRLPDMDGYEVTRQLLQNNPGLKVIAQTAYAGNDDKQKAFKAGCIDYLSKPIKRNLLLSMVNKHFSQRD